MVTFYLLRSQANIYNVEIENNDIVIMLHAFKNCSTCSCFISFYAFQRAFLLLSYYYVVILSFVLARKTKIMYNIFLFNFTFKCNFKCNYHVYKFYPGCRT